MCCARSWHERNKVTSLQMTRLFRRPSAPGLRAVYRAACLCVSLTEEQGWAGQAFCKVVPRCTQAYLCIWIELPWENPKKSVSNLWFSALFLLKLLPIFICSSVQIWQMRMSSFTREIQETSGKLEKLTICLVDDAIEGKITEASGIQALNTIILDQNFMAVHSMCRMENSMLARLKTKSLIFK